MTRRTAGGPDQSISIEGFLAAEGFVTVDSAATARAALEAERITRPGKVGFSSLKLDRAREVIEARIARVCNRAECHAVLEVDGRETVEVARHACEVCGGSNNQASMREMIVACRAAEVSRVLVVGGTPRQHDALSGLATGEGLEIRFVSGTDKEPNQRDALSDCAWADLVVVWAPTPLSHKVSNLYAADVCDADHVEVHRRGIEALAHAVADHLRRLPGRRVARR